MEITAKLRKKFVKDCKLPIKIYEEPYFSYQMNLFNEHYDCLAKYKCFKDSIKDFSTEEEYFNYYNKIKDTVMNTIKTNPYFIEFNERNMTDWTNYITNISHYGFTTKDIFKESFIGRRFISIDMIKANFNALKYYNPAIFDNAATYEEYISKFTNNEHIINSKYIREVIFGNCNPKRQITFEKYLMSKLTLNVLSKIDIKDKIVFFSNDEIIIDITDMTSQEIDNIKQIFNEFAVVPIRIEDFILKGVYKKDLVFPQFNANDENIAYIKEVTDGTISIKKYQSLYLPMIIKTIKKGNIIDYDLIFDYNDNLCKLIETPDIYIKE